MLKWKPIYECDDDDGNPTVWATEVNHHKYGKFIWITKVDDNEFEITTSNYDEPIKVCKTLTSAKRWVAMNT